ncbi:MAG: flagellar basal body-associated FliL family protein [Gudongella sp.]|nr:flagellar basal body-associated FliL family protein [Gudongella sp.]
MDKTEIGSTPKVKKKINKKILIIILAVILALIIGTSVLIYAKVKGVPVKSLIEKYLPEKSEQTLSLNEFLVNLNYDTGPSNEVLRINIAIKYIDSKNTERMVSEVPMIRDIILTNLRDLQAESILEEEIIYNFKKNTKDDINELLQQDIVTQVYVTDLIIR